MGTLYTVRRGKKEGAKNDPTRHPHTHTHTNTQTNTHTHTHTHTTLHYTTLHHTVSLHYCDSTNKSSSRKENVCRAGMFISDCRSIRLPPSPPRTVSLHYNYSTHGSPHCNNTQTHTHTHNL